MSKVFAFALAFGWMPHGAAQVVAANPVPTQTPVEIELQDRVSSELMHEGQEVSFKTVRPVVVGDTTVMEAGMRVTGEMKQVKASGAWQKSGFFDLVLKPLRLKDGTVVQLDFHRPKLTSSNRAGKIAETVVEVPFVMYYFPFIPFAVVGAARHGKPYEIRPGERYLVYVVFSEKQAEATPPVSGLEEPGLSPPK